MSENVQVSNDESQEQGIEALQKGESPESTDFSSSDFFEALDGEVNGGILEQSQTTPQQPQPEMNQPTPSETGGEPYNVASPVDNNQQSSDIENLQKRYSDSSREAKKLSSRLSEIEPYLPVLDAMREDPNLIQHVRNYFEGGGQAPVSMKEHLQLDEDFVFDADQAMSDPNSESAQLLSATIDGVVQKRLNNALSTQQRENQRLTKEANFRQKYNMTEEQWSNFIKFAKDKTLELDDIYYLMNKGSREQNIAKNANQQVSQQMKKAQSKPQSLASTGSQQEPAKSADDEVFDTILGTDSLLEKAFGS